MSKDHAETLSIFTWRQSWRQRIDIWHNTSQLISVKYANQFRFWKQPNCAGLAFYFNELNIYIHTDSPLYWNKKVFFPYKKFICWGMGYTKHLQSWTQCDRIKNIFLCVYVHICRSLVLLSFKYISFVHGIDIYLYFCTCLKYFGI